MKTTVLGTGTDAPLTVGRLGLGLMGISAFYTGAGQDDAGGARTILGALDRGVTLLDTAEMRRLAPEAPARRLLAAATVGGAEALGLAADFGTIEAGRRAELVVVDTGGVADPEEAVLQGLDATRVRPWPPSGRAGVH